MGARVARRRARGLRRLRTHPPRPRGRRRPRRPRARGPARSGRRPVPAGAARRRARRAARGGEGRSAEPRQPRGAAAGRGQCGAVRGVLRHRQADRHLLREADREQGRAGAVRGAAGTRRACRHRRLRRLPGDARGGGAAGDALHRPARAPASRAPAAALRRRRGALDLPGGVRDGGRRGRVGRSAAGRRGAFGARRGGRGLGREYPPGLEHVSAFATGDAAALRQRIAEILALPPEERRELGAAARRAVERNWSWARIAERLLV